ncbi:uncharacterized protein LOC128863968 [Anastrepha ludens]|uniref:uncharacterized protein LOC128863968 n=1 Tax=Anastrepha ludens TaxID=28586 RepID=UPI0023B1EEE7|nr:uncharacterized protein LOC128863968 [Anastrepha ludens]
MVEKPSHAADVHITEETRENCIDWLVLTLSSWGFPIFLHRLMISHTFYALHNLLVRCIHFVFDKFCSETILNLLETGFFCKLLLLNHKFDNTANYRSHITSVTSGGTKKTEGEIFRTSFVQGVRDAHFVMLPQKVVDD